MKLNSRSIKLLSLFFVVILFLIGVFSALNFNPTNNKQKERVFSSHADVLNSNLGLDTLNVRPLLKCDWGSRDVNLSNSSYDKVVPVNADCSSYFPASFSRQFFIYISGGVSLTSPGVYIEAKEIDPLTNKNKIIVPSIKDTSTFSSFQILNSIQNNLSSKTEPNTPPSLFEQLSMPNKSVGFLYETKNAYKLSSIKIGIVKQNGELKRASINVQVTPGETLKVYMGHLNVGETLESTIKKIQEDTLKEDGNRFIKFREELIGNGVSLATLKGVYDFNSTGWNNKVYNSKSINVKYCVENTEEELLLTNFYNLEKFCEHLVKIYTSDNQRNFSDFYFSVSGLNSDQGVDLDAYIDGNYSLNSQGWDMLLFNTKTITLKNFPFQAINEEFLFFWEKSFVNRSSTIKLKEISFINVGLTDEILSTSFQKIWDIVKELDILNFENNKVSFNIVNSILERINVKDLNLNDIFSSTKILDLSKHKDLISLSIRGSSIEEIILDAPLLRFVQLSGLGLSKIIGLKANSFFDRLDLSGNNLSSLDLNNSVNIRELILKNNSFSSFFITINQSIISIDVSSNSLSLFVDENTKLEHLNIENNNIFNLELKAEKLSTLKAKGNKIAKLDFNFDELEYVDLSENVGIFDVLEKASFKTKKLKDFFLNDVGLSEINSSWFSNQDVNFTLSISNVNEKTEDDNLVESIDLTSIKKLIKLEASGVSLKSFLYAEGVLEELDISNNNLKEVDLGLSRMKTLNLSSNKKNSSLVDVLISKMDTLKSISLNNTKSDWSEVFLDNFFSKLTSLSLSSNGLETLPAYLINYHNHLEYLNVANNNLNTRIDLSGYDKLIELDLSNNKDIFAIINFENVSSIKKLNVSGISKVLNKIVDGNENLETLIASNTNLISAKPIALLFPNVKTIDISDNKNFDTSTLREISVIKVQTTSSEEEVANILLETSEIKQLILLGVDFNVLDFTRFLTDLQSVYRIVLDPERISIEGEDQYLEEWFRELSFKNVFLLDKKENIVYLNDLIIEKEFNKAMKDYDLSLSEVEEQKKNFESKSPILNSKQYNDTIAEINTSINLQNSEKVVEKLSREKEYTNLNNALTEDLSKRLSDFELTLYTLLGITLIITLGISIALILIFRSRKLKED